MGAMVSAGLCAPHAPLQRLGRLGRTLPTAFIQAKASESILSMERPQLPQTATGNACPVISLLTNVIHFQQQNFKTAPQRSAQTPPTAPLQNADVLLLNAFLTFLHIFKDIPDLMFQEMTVQ